MRRDGGREGGRKLGGGDWRRLSRASRVDIEPETWTTLDRLRLAWGWEWEAGRVISGTCFMLETLM